MNAMTFPLTDALCEDISVRRRLVRASPDVNGIDYVEVKDVKPNEGTATIILSLLKRVGIGTENLAVDALLAIIEVKPSEEENAPLARVYHISVAGTVKLEGNYILKIHDANNPDTVMPGFDPLLSESEFSFDINEETDRDLPAASPCPPASLDEPDMHYLAKDYASFRQLVLDRLSLIMPAWRERHVPDLGITLVELLAYVGDHLSYYQDAVATEAYLHTARQRISVRRHARLVDYCMHEGCNARALLCLEAEVGDPEIDFSDVYFITDHGFKFPLRGVISRESDLIEAVRRERYEIFEPVILADKETDRAYKKKLYYAHNRIDFYTWGERECCLPKGATRATLRDGPGLPVVGGADQSKPEEQTAEQKGDDVSPADREKVLREQLHQRRVLQLQQGDVLIFEEIRDPDTGLEDDADPAHRHAVRLTQVTQAYDLVGRRVEYKNERGQVESRIERQAVLEIEWDPADAMPFPLCLSAITDDCEYLENISIARGNVILVDHGVTVEENLPKVEPLPSQVTCDECGEILHPQSHRYRPHLKQYPVVFREEIQPKSPIMHQLQSREPRAALPQLELTVVDEVIDELQIADDIATMVNNAVDVKAIQQKISEFLKEVDGNARLSFAAKAKAREIGDRINAEIKKNTSVNQNDLLKICNEQKEKLHSEVLHWLARSDLLSSGGDDRHFVVEVDDDRVAHLRFGDDELGERPVPDTQFEARYRIGEPLAGNVGSEAICRMIVRSGHTEDVTRVRNPL
ncbi:MAG: hypothetical protein JXA33_16825, partial [Anaerolineae bacterium]|nr:hypothetical protein [Anaerolineae bacterium]